MIQIEIQNNITLKEVKDSVYSAGTGHRIYKIFGIRVYKKNFQETISTTEENKKGGIGFTKKKE